MDVALARDDWRWGAAGLLTGYLLWYTVPARNIANWAAAQHLRMMGDIWATVFAFKVVEVAWRVMMDKLRERVEHTR